MDTLKNVITSLDVARHAGVSRLAGRARSPCASVAPPDCEKVLASAKALGYQVNMIARTMKRRAQLCRCGHCRFRQCVSRQLP